MTMYEAYKQAQRAALAERAGDIEACVEACRDVCGVPPRSLDPRLERGSVVVIVDDMFELRKFSGTVQIRTTEGWQTLTLDTLANAEPVLLPERDVQALQANTAKILHQVYDVLLLTYSMAGGDSERLRALHAEGKLGHDAG